MVTLTAAAARKVKALARSQGKEPVLRVKVGAGGCSGMSYEFELAKAVAPGDVLAEKDGAKAVVDPKSDFFIGGSEVDYHEDMMGSGFRVQNPNATSTCSCGTSFSVEQAP